MNNKSLNPTYKSGVKTLTPIQINNGLPGYDLLKSKIEIIRENSLNNIDIKNSLFENLKYDNIFSILGGRGAGKTSILFTLYEYLKNDPKQAQNINILMPLIMPELIENSENFIGWILAAVEQNLEEIEAEITRKGYRDDNSYYNRICKEYNFFERCMFNKHNGLRKAFEELKKSYYYKIFSNRAEDQDYNADLDLVSNSTVRGFALVKKFSQYWDMLVMTYLACFGSTDHTDQSKNPLIFIMIDDADLKPQIINELIFALPKFFSHPNVVVIISASQKILNYTVKNFMFQQITKNEFDLTSLMDIEYKHNYLNRNDEGDTRNIKFHELRYGREYDKIKNLTDEILRKLFPVCNRFYLKKYDRYEEKCDLKFESDNGKVLPISRAFASIIREFKTKILEFHKTFYFPKGVDDYTDEMILLKEEKFKLLDSEEYNISNPIYLSFLGRYPRDIVGVYYSLKDALAELIRILEHYYQSDDKEKEDNFVSEIYNTSINFINSVITSNRNLKPFCRESYDLILRQKLDYSLFINYEMILSIMCDKAFFLDNKEHPDFFLEMFCLLNFVEQLIYLVLPARKSHHGQAEFKRFLNSCGIKIIKQSDDLDKMLRQYYSFKLSNILKFNISNSLHREEFLRIVNDLRLFPRRKQVDISPENRDWYNFLAEVAFFSYSKISIIDHNKEQFFILEEAEFVDDTYAEICEEYYTQLHKWIKGTETSEVIDGSPINQIGIIDRFAVMALSLSESLNNLVIHFNSSSGLSEELSSYAYELSQAEGLYELKRIFNNFVDMLDKNKYTIHRFTVIQTLKSMQQALLLEDYTDLPYVFSWYRRLVLRLKQDFSIVYDDDYDAFIEACVYIKENMDEYIENISAYFSQSLPTNSSNELMRRMEKNRYLKVYISNLYEREWRRLRGLE